MPDPIIVIDSSEIREGKLEELKTALKELVDFVKANEADPIAYNIYFDENGTRMTVVQIHPSSASMRQKAQLLGNAPVVVNELHAGFARFEGSKPDGAARVVHR